MKSGEPVAKAQPRAEGARPQGGANTQVSSGALKNDALKQLEQFRAALKRG
jgi:hypothetical protein